MANNNSIKGAGPKIKFDRDNPKTGGILGVSIDPWYSCPKDAPCFLESLKALHEGRRPICYWMRGNYFEGGTLKNGRNDSKVKKGHHNYMIYAADPQEYFRQISEEAFLQAFFRWHDGGDIPDRRYFEGMIWVAKQCKNTKFTAYTKQYNLINNYLAEGHRIPKNLNIIFSLWEGYPCNNPYNLPTFKAVPKEELPNDSKAYICPCSYKTHKEHTCKDCIKVGGGCYLAKHAQEIFEALH